jgi:hypothetical protein
MNSLKNKFNKLSKNKLVFTETSNIDESSNNSKNDENKNKPTGGFPPIYIVNNDESELSKQKFNLSSNMKDIDINELLKKKKNKNDLFI